MSNINEMYNEAEDLRDAGKHDEAIEKCTAILEQDDTHVLTHLQLAHLYSQVGNPELSVRHCERACALEPNDAQNFRVMSVTYRKAFTATQDEMYIHKAEEAMARAAMLQ